MSGGCERPTRPDVDEFVRPATVHDLPELGVLERSYRLAISSTPRGGAQWLRDAPELGDTGWSERLNDPNAATYVAGVDGVVLGYASMTVAQRGQSDAVAVVDGIFVDEGARELGLGDSLLAALIESATLSGASEIESNTLPGDRDTKNLYERAGLVARLLTVSKPLT